MRYEIPVYWFPSALLVLKEYMILSSIECPNCGQKSLKRIKQEVLPKTPQIPYPIVGDRLICRCKNCGYSVIIEFIFRPPGPDDDPLKDFEEIYTSLLNKCASQQVPDYFSFLRKLLLVLEDIRAHKPNIMKKILEKLLNELTLYYSEMRGTTNVKTFNKLKLVLNLVSKLPSEEFEWIIQRVPERIRNTLQTLRQEA